MHIAASVPENDPQNFLWDFDIQMNPLISARRADLIIINKKQNKTKKKKTTKKKTKTNNEIIYIIAVPADHRIKLKECEEKDMYQDFLSKLKKKQKTMEHESDDCTNRDGVFGTVSKGLLNELEEMAAAERVEKIQTTA